MSSSPLLSFMVVTTSFPFCLFWGGSGISSSVDDDVSLSFWARRFWVVSALLVRARGAFVLPFLGIALLCLLWGMGSGGILKVALSLVAIY